MKSLVFKEFSGRTAMYPIRALLYFGWELEYGRTAPDARQTFLGIHGVGKGIANMLMLLIERTNLKHFSKDDHVLMDVKPDMQVVKVLYRLGIIHCSIVLHAVCYML